MTAASVGDTEANEVAAATMPSTPRPAIAPMTAVTIGSPAAMTLPKPSCSTMISAMMPMSSERRSPVFGWAAWPSRPP
ncbi:hypothetical protein [Trebonia kvetii]|uniref:hypothetical protein n=1 Tax=Trebonia kvetii TaxID=2480626 RepID=UPI001FE4778E|nr:hypothetical protein [Trebonia kvetii]